MNEGNWYEGYAKRITLVSSESGDWVVLYRGERKILEGHSLRLKDVLCALGFKVTSFEVSDSRMGEGSPESIPYPPTPETF